MIRKVTTLALCLIAFIAPARAQEFGVALDGGLQGMHYSLRNGETKLLPGGSLNLNYVFPIYKGFGILTGIGAGLYRTQATLQNGLTFAYNEIDDQGAAFLYNVRFTEYKETQQTLAVTIPLLLQYHTDGAGVQWYIDGGAKAFLPVKTSIKVTSQQINLSGYYPNYDLVISDLPQHGFGTVNGWKSNAAARLKASAAVSTATGFSFGISHGTRLYAGVYADYGLLALKSKTDSLPMVTYSPGGIGKVTANGVLKTQNAGEPKWLSFGVQLRLTWGSKPAKKHTTARHKKKPDPVPTAVPPGAPISDSELITIQRPIVFGIVRESDIPGTQTPLLDDVVTIMQQHPDLRISIEGYTCDGTQQTEDAKVGDARAKAVARYLERKGIDRRRIDISSAKQSEPSKSYDPAANFRNRRVLINPE